LRINGHFSLHLADVGFNARVVKRFEQDKKRGLLVYARHLFRELFLIKVYRFQILCDGRKFKRKAVSLTFANSSKYGTGAVINPVGRIDDGKFELCIVKPFPKYYLPVIAFKFFAGNVHESDYVEIVSCREALITCSRKTTLQIDGEVIGKTSQIKVEMFSRSVKIILPPE
ncbi:MAG TPA: diacylglycerol kinase, partial [Anseongella sp.]|nr:diacylglycerol kinase [Anseongella sp.]